MKKSTKALLMAALCMLIVGAAFCIAGASFGFTFSQFREEVEKGSLQIEFPFGKQKENAPLTETAGKSGSNSSEMSVRHLTSEAEYEGSFEDVDSLDLELGVVQCSIILWGEDHFQVVGNGLPDGFECRKDGNELEIDCEESDWKFWENMEGAELQLYIPREQVLSQVVISAGVGDIDVTDGFLRCEKLKLDCGVGESRLSVEVEEQLEIDGGVGEVFLELKGEEEDFNYDLDNGIGEVVIGSSHLKDLGVDEQIDNGASKKVVIDNGIGNITIRFSEE